MQAAVTHTCIYLILQHSYVHPIYATSNKSMSVIHTLHECICAVAENTLHRFSCLQEVERQEAHIIIIHT